MKYKNIVFLGLLTLFFQSSQVVFAAGAKLTDHDVLKTKPGSKDLEYADKNKGELKLTPGKTIIKVLHARDGKKGDKDIHGQIGIIEKTDNGRQLEEFYLINTQDIPIYWETVELRDTGKWIEIQKRDYQGNPIGEPIREKIIERIITRHKEKVPGSIQVCDDTKLQFPYNVEKDSEIERSHQRTDVTKHYDENGKYIAFRELDENDQNFKKIIEEKADDEDLIEVVRNDKEGKPELNKEGKILYRYYLVKNYVDLTEELKGLEDTKKISSLNPLQKINFTKDGKIYHKPLVISDGPERPGTPKKQNLTPGKNPDPQKPNENTENFFVTHKYKIIGFFSLITILSSLYHKHKKLSKKLIFRNNQSESFLTFAKRTLKKALLNPMRSFDEDGNEAITIAVWSMLIAGSSCLLYDLA